VQWPIKPVVKITIIASSVDNPAVETVMIFTIGSNDQYAMPIYLQIMVKLLGSAIL
jgi:hypothetical protein